MRAAHNKKKKHQNQHRAAGCFAAQPRIAVVAVVAVVALAAVDDVVVAPLVAVVAPLAATAAPSSTVRQWTAMALLEGPLNTWAERDGPALADSLALWTRWRRWWWVHLVAVGPLVVAVAALALLVVVGPLAVAVAMSMAVAMLLATVAVVLALVAVAVLPWTKLRLCLQRAVAVVVFDTAGSPLLWTRLRRWLQRLRRWLQPSTLCFHTHNRSHQG